MAAGSRKPAACDPSGHCLEQKSPNPLSPESKSSSHKNLPQCLLSAPRCRQPRVPGPGVFSGTWRSGKLSTHSTTVRNAPRACRVRPPCANPPCVCADNGAAAARRPRYRASCKKASRCWSRRCTVTRPAAAVLIDLNRNAKGREHAGDDPHSTAICFQARLTVRGGRRRLCNPIESEKAEQPA